MFQLKGPVAQSHDRIGSYIGEFASFADPSHIFLLKKSKKSWENYLDAVELEKQGPAL